MKLILRAMRDPVDKPEGSRVKMRHADSRGQTKAGARTLTKISLFVDKAQLRLAILQQLRAELDLQAGAAAMARDEATSEESRAENKWDTHSQEAAYLAEGQAKLAAEIGTSMEVYSSLPLPAFAGDAPIAVGAIVELEANGKRACYFIGPRAGGLELAVAGRALLVLTPSSPLGGQLLGKHAGDVVPSPGRGGRGTQRIVAVS